MSPSIPILHDPLVRDPDKLTWTGEGLQYSTCLEEFPETLGIPPTAKSMPPEIKGFSLPGHGDPYDSCGRHAYFICEKCDHVEPVEMNCRRSTCPKCYTTWAWLLAK
ncbi:hypothetical protein ES703_105118 [subsurface metagenome]